MICFFLVGLYCGLLAAPGLAAAESSLLPSQEPEYLTFDELKLLSQNPHPPLALRKKLNRFWTTPVISNEAYQRGIRPLQPIHPKIGKGLLVSSWNIEKSLEMDRVISMFKSEAVFQSMIDRKKAPEHSKLDRQIHIQRQNLLNSDLLILQEIEQGVKRSGYRDAARDLARGLNMNYAYAAQYLEIDPVMLGLETIRYEDGSVDRESTDYYATDAKRYKGVFGSAVLSRYPIKFVEVRPLKNQPYDWYWGEKDKPSFTETLRRAGGEALFKNQITRELKVGGRIYFRVDLEVPQIPGGTLTVINIHLEIKCLPEGRQKQLEEILNNIRGIKNPVILMGDFNAAPEDLSPTSLSREAERAVKNPTNWLSLAINAVNPNALAINTSRGLSNVTKNFQDPTSRHIPIVAPNPVKPLFEAVENFQFSDGGVFDFRGDGNRSVGKKTGTLANSNQRDRKGFKTTFSVKRPIGTVLGKYRLDWVFVKSFLRYNPRDTSGPYLFAPHFGETLEEMNTSVSRPFSDHHPNILFLPFEETRTDSKAA